MNFSFLLALLAKSDIASCARLSPGDFAVERRQQTAGSSTTGPALSRASTTWYWPASTSARPSCHSRLAIDVGPELSARVRTAAYASGQVTLNTG